MVYIPEDKDKDKEYKLDSMFNCLKMVDNCEEPEYLMAAIIDEVCQTLAANNIQREMQNEINNCDNPEDLVGQLDMDTVMERSNIAQLKEISEIVLLLAHSSAKKEGLIEDEIPEARVKREYYKNQLRSNIEKDTDNDQRN